MTKPCDRNQRLNRRGLESMVVTLLTVTAVVTLLFYSGSARLFPAQAPTARAGEIRFDFTPAMDPTSLLLILHDNGRSEVVHYNRYQLVVVSVGQGIVSAADIRRTVDTIRNPDFQDSLRRNEAQTQQQAPADLFHLSVNLQGTSGEYFGAVPDGTGIVRSLVEDLVRFGKRLEEAPMAPAYLRASTVAQERFDELRRRGQVRLVSVQQLAPDLRAIVTATIGQPGNFNPLSRAQYDRLLKSNGYEFFVLERTSQLTLFAGRR